ncbi:MAG: hypothetical protein A3H59_01340 [Candidatus Jacksonbacteria bacterium RIFCSPLOWO2_02_FULL_43_9]|nr:MAG: hypothetical protein UV70_C0009G0026 [Parcubacteria group bacterium GW2011_GWA2_43_13]OGY69957.1 MAG: hypothetical protein A3B94_00880 [Candidatus Jacksonbacteria bacterium RIFCSPHIGHO2_02_FULL_43_10]OGY70810.1 MAG: hypothetical protein A2986_00475 [Candidatus Jacksonbacteria bacterium RIFCSPLOWO2_01_FULL_44_13]OGY73553.1 MAG: hypothetical protein A3H59_01340 [Candidatus Jacksonbacteria bacterium RIFCSPLOWO2_02_FULL_43_9]HAZ17110.1 hypothetical protein [Candidatus Jacksonbacteria bacter
MSCSNITLLEIQEESLPHHRKGFVDLYKEAFGEAPYFETYDEEDIIRDVWNPHLIDGCIVLATDDMEVIGLGCALSVHKASEIHTFLCSLPSLPFPIETTVYISELAVNKKYRRHGIGTRLVSAMLDWARRNGFTHYVMRTASEGSNSIGLFRRLGACDIPQGIQHLQNVNSASISRVYLYG